MRNRQPKITNGYNQIKSDNLIKRIIPPKITQNRVNLIPIPKKLINEKIDNYSVSNFLNSQIYSTNDKYKNQYNMQDSNIKKVQINQQNFQKPLNRNSLLSGHNNNILIKKLEPENDFNTKEFKIIKKLGEGTFGKIYAIKWLKTNDLYALKKMDLDEYDVYVFQKKVRIIQNCIKSTKHNGVIKLYGDKSIPIQNTNQFNYYVIMELAERDFEKEINSRRAAKKLMTKYEAKNQYWVPPTVKKIEELGIRVVAADLLSESDLLRHNPNTLANIIANLVVEIKNSANQINSLNNDNDED
jgi:hypothetical protein